MRIEMYQIDYGRPTCGRGPACDVTGCNAEAQYGMDRPMTSDPSERVTARLCRRHATPPDTDEPVLTPDGRRIARDASFMAEWRRAWNAID